MVFTKSLLVLLWFLSCYTTTTSSALFNPPDNYLISCGSSQNITFQNRIFVPDSLHSSLVLKIGNSSVATSTTSNNSTNSIYQTARVFSGLASYRFKITSLGRHWIRLHFSPINNSTWNLTSASITVVTEDFVLLNNFSFNNFNGSYIFKEYTVNVTSEFLTLSFIPSNNSVVFVNAIEVVSVPDNLIPDQALALNPSTPFSGLSLLAFETVYRLNMGGPLLTSQNDTLGRQWDNDAEYLHVNSSVLVVTANPSSIKYSPSVTQETAPNMVYATADTMGDANVASPSFNVTWVLPVDPDFRYFVRVHFCDIVSQALNTLVFNLYVNDDLALGSLDLSTLTNGLKVPYFKDFISNGSVESSGVLTVSVGPDSQADITNATMNGLEVLKISNEAKSLSGVSSVKSLLPGGSGSKSKKKAVIIGSLVGAVTLILLIAVCCYCCLVASRKQRSTSPQEGGNGHPWLPLPLYGLSQTLTKSTASHKSATASCISLASTHLGRCFMRQQLTEKSDVYSFGVVLMEVLCCRPALNPVLPREQVNIAEWAMAWQKKGLLDQIMDSNLTGKVNPASLKKFGETAEKCLAEYGVDRPSMGDVLWNLEYALQLEETSSALMEPDDNSTNHIPGIPMAPMEPFDNSMSIIDRGGVNSGTGTDDDAEDATTSAVFSQLVHPRGR
ncbi:unnamed protein product [Arabidopsis thaliana]|uniref:(thale cress) hypothetical protein n=1 Tax=Arabidopsis thaliana TaxID=3702 RepID=A0A7G2FMI0_ARATH|nr:unnamed protein product [Arabidopsis thaliana]